MQILGALQPAAVPAAPELWEVSWLSCATSDVQLGHGDAQSPVPYLCLLGSSQRGPVSSLWSDAGATMLCLGPGQR